MVADSLWLDKEVTCFPFSYKLFFIFTYIMHLMVSVFAQIQSWEDIFDHTTCLFMFMKYYRPICGLVNYIFLIMYLGVWGGKLNIHGACLHLSGETLLEVLYISLGVMLYISIRTCQLRCEIWRCELRGEGLQFIHHHHQQQIPAFPLHWIGWEILQIFDNLLPIFGSKI